MEVRPAESSRSHWIEEQKPATLKEIHIVDTMPEFHYNCLKSMYMDVITQADDHRLLRSCKTGLLLRDNETIQGPCSLSTGGITGAQVPPLYKFTNRGPHACSNLAKAWPDLDKSTPAVRIPEHVNRPSNIPEASDISGAAPHPKYMKIGREARGTNPLEPVYSLPSHVECLDPIPKFVRDSIDVGDIEGARPSSRHRRLGRPNQLNVTDIEGSHAGWKPFHLRKFGNEVRNLCLDVEDICGPSEERAVRPSTSEVYQDIQGSHSKHLTKTRSTKTPVDFSLNTRDIEGACAGSGAWEKTTRRRKEFATNHMLDANEQEEIQQSALNFLRTRMQDEIKLRQLSSKDVSSTFELLDRQNSGKLSMDEVNRAFKALRLDVCARDLNCISKAFVDPNGDGYLDYWKLLNHMVPLLPRKHGARWDNPNNVGRSMDQSIKLPGQMKPGYEAPCVADSAVKAASGNKFVPFNSGRPVKDSRSLKQGASVQQHSPGGHSIETGCRSKPGDGSNRAKTMEVYSLNSPVPERTPDGIALLAIPSSGPPPVLRTKSVAEELASQPVQQPQSEISLQPATEDLHSHLAKDIFREVPVLSVLQDAEPHPAQISAEAHFQEIVPGNEPKVKKRNECLFSKLPPSHQGPPVPANAEPIFEALKRSIRCPVIKPLPFGCPFWPGHVDVLPENLAPPVVRSPDNGGPLPMGGSFWLGVKKSQPTPRASLWKDYSKPSLKAQLNFSEDVTSAGGRGNEFPSSGVDQNGQRGHDISHTLLSRPGTAYESSSVDRNQNSSRLQSSSTLRSWRALGEDVGEEMTRLQTVNSQTGGSPSQHFLGTTLGSNQQQSLRRCSRPSTAQSFRASAERGFPLRPASAGFNRCQVARLVETKAALGAEKRLKAQLQDDIDAVRHLR